MISRITLSSALMLCLLATGCSEPMAVTQAAPQGTGNQPKASDKDPKPMPELTLATFGGGCFWCTEAVFLELEGVEGVVSGYSGGKVQNPTYQEVCSGSTGHAEVIQVEYDPKKVSFEELLEVHFKTHDPTTLNRQGNDVGTQYRSAVFYHTDEQAKTAKAIIKALNDSGAYNSPIVTEVTEFTKFWPAEEYHQNYFAQNPNQGYCRAIVQPKVEKFRKVFKDKLKKPNKD